jgi:hypothetical protein
MNKNICWLDISMHNPHIKKHRHPENDLVKNIESQIYIHHREFPGLLGLIIQVPSIFFLIIDSLALPFAGHSNGQIRSSPGAQFCDKISVLVPLLIFFAD